LQDGYKVEKMRSIRWIVSTKETYSMRANIIVKENRLMMMDPSFFLGGRGMLDLSGMYAKTREHSEIKRGRPCDQEGLARGDARWCFS
jgi:hypothetical protein